MASETFSYIPKQIWGEERPFPTSDNISKNAQFSSWSWNFANVMKKCMYFLRKAHLIMRQYFHMIGCNVSKKSAFQLWNEYIWWNSFNFKKGAFFFENIIFSM